MWKNNMPFARFLKQLLKNCQRIRSKRDLKKPKGVSFDEIYAYQLETERIIRFYLYDKLLPFGLIGGERYIRLLVKHAKVIKNLGKAAKKQKKVLFFKTAYIKYVRRDKSCDKFDWRTVPFVDFYIEEYEMIKNIPFARIDYRCDPF